MNDSFIFFKYARPFQKMIAHRKEEFVSLRYKF